MLVRTITAASEYYYDYGLSFPPPPAPINVLLIYYYTIYCGFICVYNVYTYRIIIRILLHILRLQPARAGKRKNINFHDRYYNIPVLVDGHKLSRWLIMSVYPVLGLNQFRWYILLFSFMIRTRSAGVAGGLQFLLQMQRVGNEQARARRYNK